MHVVCAWIGNSAAIAQEHYLQVTDEHFAQAIEHHPPSTNEDPAHNQAQSAAVTVGMSQESPNPQKKNRPDLPSDSEQPRYLHTTQVPPRGVEPLSSG